MTMDIDRRFFGIVSAEFPQGKWRPLAGYGIGGETNREFNDHDCEDEKGRNLPGASTTLSLRDESSQPWMGHW
jgi:hypothetical protein